jgi:hypothetical protein
MLSEKWFDFDAEILLRIAVEQLYKLNLNTYSRVTTPA